MVEVVEHHIDQVEGLRSPAEVEEHHIEERRRAAVGDSLAGAAAARMGADRSRLAAEGHHKRPEVEGPHSRPAEADILLEAGILGFASVEADRMAVVGGMENLMVGDTGRNSAEESGLGMEDNRLAAPAEGNTTC